MKSALAIPVTFRRRRRRVDPEFSFLPGTRTGQKPIKPVSFQRRVPTMFSLSIRDREGRLSQLQHRSNLRTNDGIDLQAGVMGDLTSMLIGGNVAAATGVGAQSVTRTGASFTAQASIGHLIVATNPSTNTAIVYGVCEDNNTTTVVLDGWHSASNPSNFGTTPGTTGYYYHVLPGGAPAWYLGLSTDATTPAATDVLSASAGTVTGEITTSDFARAIPTSFTHTAGTSTYSVSKSYTAANTYTINKVAFMNAAKNTATNGFGSSLPPGRMPFESLEPNPPTVISGDTLAETATITYT